MIRRAGATLLVLALLTLPGFAPTASAQDRPGGRPPSEKRVERKPANVPFLFSAFLITWLAIWGYLVAIHRKQKRLEKTLARMEKER